MDFVMIEASVFLQDNLGHRVCEGNVVSKTNVGFRDRRLAIDAGHDQGPRMSHAWLAARQGDEHQVNRFIDNLIPWDADESSIIEEGRVESDKGMLFIVGVFCQIMFECLRVPLESLPKA